MMLLFVKKALVGPKVEMIRMRPMFLNKALVVFSNKGKVQMLRPVFLKRAITNNEDEMPRINEAYVC